MTEAEKMAAAESVRQEFENEYKESGPFAAFIEICGLTRRYQVEPSHCYLMSEVREEIIEKGEDPDEWYIYVGLREALPQNLQLPAVYKGYKVFTQIVGKIWLQ